MIASGGTKADRAAELLTNQELARRWARWMAIRTAPLVDGRTTDELQRELEALHQEWLEQEDS